MDGDLLSAEARSLIGKPTGAPQSGEVTAKECARFAYAVDDRNPLYFDDDYARAAGYDRAIAPPLIYPVPLIGAWPMDANAEDGTPPHWQPWLPIHGRSPYQMQAGEEVEFHRPIYPGDTIRAESVLESADQKEGRSGPIHFMVRRTTYRNQQDEIVLVARTTMVAQ